ncbi:hypothetical protein IAU60_001579 [Kwoniella sp. DSM 27419]
MPKHRITPPSDSEGPESHRLRLASGPASEPSDPDLEPDSKTDSIPKSETDPDPDAEFGHFSCAWDSPGGELPSLEVPADHASPPTMAISASQTDSYEPKYHGKVSRQELLLALSEITAHFHNKAHMLCLAHSGVGGTVRACTEGEEQNTPACKKAMGSWRVAHSMMSLTDLTDTEEKLQRIPHDDDVWTILDAYATVDRGPSETANMLNGLITTRGQMLHSERLKDHPALREPTPEEMTRIGVTLARGTKSFPEDYRMISSASSTRNLRTRGSSSTK